MVDSDSLVIPARNDPPASPLQRAVNFAVIAATAMLVVSALIVENLMDAGIWRVAAIRLGVGAVIALGTLGISLGSLAIAGQSDQRG